MENYFFSGDFANKGELRAKTLSSKGAKKFTAHPISIAELAEFAEESHSRVTSHESRITI